MAVKFSILGVVLLSSSYSYDFMTWESCQLCMFRGQALELLMWSQWFIYLPPGGCGGLLTIRSEILRKFKKIWWLLMSKVTGIGTLKTSKVRQPRRLSDLLMTCAHSMSHSRYYQRQPLKMWKDSSFSLHIRRHCPIWPPVQGRMWKNETFWKPSYILLQNLITGLEIVPRGFLRPNMGQGGYSVTATLKGL